MMRLASPLCVFLQMSSMSEGQCSGKSKRATYETVSASSWRIELSCDTSSASSTLWREAAFSSSGNTCTHCPSAPSAPSQYLCTRFLSDTAAAWRISRATLASTAIWMSSSTDPRTVCRLATASSAALRAASSLLNVCSRMLCRLAASMAVGRAALLQLVGCCYRSGGVASGGRVGFFFLVRQWRPFVGLLGPSKKPLARG